MFGINKYENKISDLLEFDPVCVEYREKKESGNLSKSEKLDFVKYLIKKVMEYSDLIDKGLL